MPCFAPRLQHLRPNLTFYSEIMSQWVLQQSVIQSVHLPWKCNKVRFSQLMLYCNEQFNTCLQRLEIQGVQW